MDPLFSKTADAVLLQERIVKSVFSYIDGDPTKSLLGIQAVVKSVTDLIGSSTMDASTRLAIGHALFYDLVRGIDLTGWESIKEDSSSLQ